MLSWVLGNRNKKKKKTGKKRPSYDDAKRLAKNGSAAERKELAKHEDLEPELLYFLADDKDPDVRVEIARNDGTPLQADQVLAKDPAAKVRTELAYKIGRLIPTLTEEENTRLAEMAMAVMQILAKDELPEVRAIISNEIKTLSNVPKKVVKSLAHDIDAAVSAPILEYSPLLSEQELIQIIAGGIQGRALFAVARRRKNSEKVSEAIVETDDKIAITELLRNETAKISEKTMEVIGMTAKNTTKMHGPLVERSNLSTNTIKRIATFVSAALIERLIERHNLDEDIVHDIRQSTRERILSGDLSGSDKEEEAPDARAQKLFESGELNESAIKKAVASGDITFIPPALSLMADIELEVVKRVLMGDSGKAVCALAWRAELGMDSAEMIQKKVANVPTRSLVSAPADGEYPLTPDDMEWYLAYFLE